MSILIYYKEMEVPTMEDNVQLREEEIVGDEVVLSDIYPKTNTSSIVDEVSGTTLNETLERIQEKINNKLSRIVNSINGRTGVVVLDSEDVGLGNVDNISFSDIKSWVINELIAEFANKRIALLNSLEEADAIAEENLEANRDRPFFAEKGYIDAHDKKSYIGYFWYDSSVNQLKASYVPIKVVGWTDGSLTYDEATAGLAVRIRSGEKALCVDQSHDHPGMYIDKSEVLPVIRYFDGVWGRIDENYTANEVRRETPSSTLDDTEFKYRHAMKGFCPATGTEPSANSCQHIIVRFHIANEGNIHTPQVGFYDYTTISGMYPIPITDYDNNYYRGDKTYNQSELGDGGINFQTIDIGEEYEIKTSDPNYDASVLFNGRRSQGLYHIDISEKVESSASSHLYNAWVGWEYALLRTATGTLHPNEMIYCAFRPPRDNNGNRNCPPGIDDRTLRFLTNRQPAFGIVRKYKGYSPEKIVVLDFYQYDVHAGWSIEHYKPGYGNIGLEVAVSTAKVGTTGVVHKFEDYENFSGLQVIAPQHPDLDKSGINVNDSYIQLTSKPTDWDDNWMNYYIKKPNTENEYIRKGEASEYDYVVKQYNRTKTYTSFVISQKPAPADIDAIIEWVEDNSKGDIAHDEKYTWLNSRMDDFKRVTPFDTFVTEPGYFHYQYVWGGKNLSDVEQDVPPAVERNEQAWTNLVRELLVRTVYYMNKEVSGYEYITTAQYNERTQVPAWEANTYYEFKQALIDRHRMVMLPSGPTCVYEKDGIRTGGLYINTDTSMCVIPRKLCYFDEGQENQVGASLPSIMRNWRATLPKTPFSNQFNNIKNKEISSKSEVIQSERSTSTSSSAIKDRDCYIGINVTKALAWFPSQEAYKKVISDEKPSDWDSLDWDTQTKYFIESDKYSDEMVYVRKTVKEGQTPTNPEWESDKYYVLRDSRKDGPHHYTWDKYYSYNASGLRVMGNYDDFDQPPMDYKWFGMNYNEYQERYHFSSSERVLDMNKKRGLMHSGGVSINVGKFLEIDPGRYTDIYANWYDYGKVNVRIGKGLTEEPVTYDENGNRLTGNKIQLKLDETNGFIFNDKGELSTKQVIPSISRLDFVDVYDTHFLYDPLPNYLLSEKITYNDIVFQLGKGLKLITEETRARDFDAAMDSLSVVQLEIFLDCSDETIFSIKNKIANRKIQCKKNDYALESDTEQIKHIIEYHPLRDQGLPYYVMSLDKMIEWAIDNQVEGVGEDNGKRDIDLMTLREFKDRCAHRYVKLDEFDGDPDDKLSNYRIAEYRTETLELITPYTEANTAPLAVMMKFFNWSDLEENVYNSIMRKASQVRQDLWDIFNQGGSVSYYETHEYYEYPPEGDDTIPYNDPVNLTLAVCADVRADLLNASKNIDSFEDKLPEESALHIRVDSLGEMWTYIVDKLGYTTAQQWLDDTSMGLTRDYIKTSIDNLAYQAGHDFDYGWSERAKIFAERLQDSSVSNVVYVRDANNTVTHKISASFLKRVNQEEHTVSPTDISKVTYQVLESEPTNWSDDSMLTEYYVKYTPVPSKSTYTANKYYRAKVKDYQKLTAEPANWSTSYWKYYVNDGSGYKHIDRVSTAPTFEMDKYYRAKSVQYVQLTDTSFTDKTFVDTGDAYAFYPPTYTSWTGKATNTGVSTSPSSTANGGPSGSKKSSSSYNSYYTAAAAAAQQQSAYRKSTKNSSKANDVIIGYTQEQEYTDAYGVTKTNKSKTIIGTSTSSGSSGSTSVNSSTDNVAIVERWNEVWHQYWVDDAGLMKTLKEVGYGDDHGKPYFVSGMFYKKIIPTSPVSVTTTTPIEDLSTLEKDDYTVVRNTGDSSPEWKTGTYYSHTNAPQYDALYTEPDDWKTMDWSNNNKYYNFKHVLITTNPGTFIPNNYYTKSDNDVYTLVGSKPVNWDSIDWTTQTDYYERKSGSQVKVRDDVTNSTWLDTGNRLTEAEKLATWVVVKVDQNAHAGLDGFQGEDLNTLMLYVLGRKWSLKEMLSRAASSGSSQWTSYGEDETSSDSSSSDSSSSSDTDSNSGT